MSESKLTLPEAIEISLAMEAATKDTEELWTKEAVGVNKLKIPSVQQTKWKQDSAQVLPL